MTLTPQQITDDWQDISTAPKKGQLVFLRSPAYSPTEAFYWSKKMSRWETIKFSAIGKYVCWWHENTEQPSQWLSVEAVATLIMAKEGTK